MLSDIEVLFAEHGYDDVVVVDDLEDGHNFVNIADHPIADYLDKDEFIERLETYTGTDEMGRFELAAPLGEYKLSAHLGPSSGCWYASCIATPPPSD